MIFHVSCLHSPKEMIHIICQILFSKKKKHSHSYKKKITNLSSITVVIGILRVNLLVIEKSQISFVP